MARRKDKQPSLIREQIDNMRQVMREELRGDPLPGQPSRPPLEMSRKADIQNMRESSRLIQPDDQVLLDSLGRLEEQKILIALREFPQSYRIIKDTDEVGKHQAIAAGFALWTPRDMFEYVHLPENQRRILASFKRVFSEGVFEWEKWRTDAV